MRDDETIFGIKMSKWPISAFTTVVSVCDDKHETVGKPICASNLC